ncbi:hypothetical protein EYF80_017217 [Liparis tanakae]|uniref:Uncharacterized protein n=1 Tax=Liparis tanakae TaxID=230148 RepID=A0A4Z2I463_9TELE|nr:hypothetical protein EYF80_017217 [Liparis tanakae]
MFDDEGLLGALQGRQHHDDAKPICPIAHHGQGKQERIHGVPLTHTGRPSATAVQLAATSALFPGNRAVAMAFLTGPAHQLQAPSSSSSSSSSFSS